MFNFKKEKVMRTFLMAILIGVACVACTTQEKTNDSTVDTTLVDTVNVDSTMVEVDSIN